MVKKIKIFRLIGLALIVISLGTASVLAYQQIYKKGSLGWYRQNIRIVKSNLGDDIKEVKCNKDCSIYDLNYQKVVTSKVNKKIKNGLDKALIIYNPYGTNTLSLNMYFNTDEKSYVRYNIHVDDEKISDYSATLNNDGEGNLTTNHQYQIIGLVAGMQNEITIELLDDNDKVIDTRVIEIDVKEISSDIDIKLDSSAGESSNSLENGLYTILGHDKNFNSNIYMYDNNGILRAELPLESYRSDRILFIEDYMVYSINNHTIAFVNCLGCINKIYDLGKDYKMHHDFIYNEEKNSILILANRKNTESIEDRIINLDLKTGEVTELIDMRDYFSEQYESAKEVGGTNAYGGDEIDWIHLNSITLVNSDEVIVSSRELSLIIKISNIYSNPTISYTLGDSNVTNNTKAEDYQYDKVGDFIDHAGQHSVTYISDSSLSAGRYYLITYNNNYKVASTRPSFDWSDYTSAGTYQEGTKSMYYKYLVDENEKIYELVDEIDLPYSSIVSSVQKLNDNIITSSGKANCYNEYDSDGKLIREYKYSAEKYAYRVFKYSFNNYWFK